MKKQDLIDIGIDEETAKQILIMHGRDIEDFKKTVAETETEKASLAGKIETYQQQLEVANRTIEDFKGMDVEGIQKSADEYKAMFEKSQQESQERIQQLQFEYTLNGVLREKKAKNPKAVIGLLDMKKLTLIEVDGQPVIDGLDDQLIPITEKDGYLFEQDETSDDDGDTPQIIMGGQSRTVLTDAFEVSAREAAGLYE